MIRRFGGARLAVGLLGAALVLAPATAQAQQPELQERTHDVRPGDTLWDLARSYLGDPFLWPEIFRLNVDAIRDPALIYPTTRLRIPGRVPVVADAPVPREPGRTVFWRGDVPQERPEEMIIRAAGTADVPIIAPGDYYAASFVARDHELAPAAILAERLDESVVPVVLEPAVTLFDVIYLAVGPGEDVRIGDRMQLVRQGAEVRDRGRIYRPTGIARVLDLNGRTATAEVVEVYHPIRVGDLALPVPPFPVEAGVSPQRISPADLEGRILGFEDRNVIHMTEARAFLDLGAVDGLREGDELLAFIPPVQRRWGVRPEVDVAVLRVVRVMERSATARVIRLEHPALEAGMPVRHTARMP